MGSFIIEKFLPIFSKIVSSKPILAIRDGLLMIMPLTIVGSLFLLMTNLPIPGYTEFMVRVFGEQWDIGIHQLIGATFDVVGIIGVFGITYTYVHNEGYPPVPAGILAIVCFLIMNKQSIILNTEIISGIFPKEFLGGKGMIGAIIIGLLVGYIYSLCLKLNLRITLPKGVPPGITQAFTSLIPFTIIMVLMVIIYTLFQVFFNQTFLEIIYQVLQKPLQGFSSSLFGAFAIPILISFFWWSGIHGSTIVLGILGPILAANGFANHELMSNGATVVVGENAYIITLQYVEYYIVVTGAGFTLGLVILMLFAKSTQFKELSKLSLIPSIFNINEPILFGVPIVFNPLMFLPFILAPLASSLIVYSAISLGFLPPFGVIGVPWTTPIIISGFIVGGWKAALIQLISLVVTTFIYLPFFKILDYQEFKRETLNTLKN
ncbi:MAG: PTS sugar transporter subunit IIC [Brevinema sp.]